MKTKNGKWINVPEGTKRHLLAHSDVSMKKIKEAVSKIDYHGGFFMEPVCLGRTVGNCTCVDILPGEKVYNLYRLNRKGTTPFVKNRLPVPTDSLVIGIVETKECNYILITAYYSSFKSPMEPWDARQKRLSEEEIKICDDFWSTHALIYDESIIDFKRSEVK